ncbi:unnamed protein product [Peniophora sp. CBMAI 1063]|nr:unnamed protein product [Peniophora sp. CBMAI 1063]
MNDMPSAGAQDSAHLNQIADEVAIAFSGLWFHEFVIHLQYDWRLFMQPGAGRPFTSHLGKWTYLACRICPLVFSICLCIFSFPGRPHCQALMKLAIVSGTLGLTCSSALLSIRVAAVWLWDKRVACILAGIDLTVLAFFVYYMVKVDSSYDPMIQSCILNGVLDDLLPSVALLAGDCVVLALLLTGLQRKWRDVRHLRLWNVLWSQGLFYLVIAALVEVPVVVLLFVDLDPGVNAIIIDYEVFLLALCSTRMFRFLNGTLGGREGESEVFTNGAPRGRLAMLQGDSVRLVTIRTDNMRQE